jgi:hypothetical protein
MPITVVLDQGVPRDAAGRLCDLGYECVHVGEVGMSMADDEEVLRFAHEKNGTVLRSIRISTRFSLFPARTDLR